MESSTETHPVFLNQYILPSNQIEELLNAIMQWKDLNTGAIVYGNSRCGKTEAINFIRGQLNEYLDIPMPVLAVEGSEELRNSSSSMFWTNFLIDIGSPLPYEGVALQRKQRAIEHIYADCLRYGSTRALLFVDDAQWYGDKDFAKLVDLHKQLRRRNVDLLVILVGQEELKLKREQLSGSSKWPIIGRFMMEMLHFKGCNLAEDLERILQGYDNDSEFPVGSSISYTQSLVPKAWNAGFRMAHIHSQLAQAIEQARLKMTNGIGLTEYPMTVIRRICNGLLIEFSKRDRPDFEPSTVLIKRCVRDYSGAMLGVNYDDLY